MSWLQIELLATPTLLSAIEAVFYECEAISIALLSAVDEPVLEPDPGETPLWASIRVQALFPLHTDMATLRQALSSLGPAAFSELAVQFVNPADWQDAARSHVVDEVFAGRLWLLPKHAKVSSPAKRDLVRLFLEPGLAFGSGSHPTTRLCLNWLAAHIRPGQRVLDFGCGSGVLGIAAGLLGATVLAVDHDPQAIMATQENAAYNGLSEAAITAIGLDAWRADRHIAEFDVVVANILAAPLQSLAPEFERVAMPGAVIVLSGVLQEQADSVMSSYLQTQFQVPGIEAGWACLVGTTRNRTSE